MSIVVLDSLREKLILIVHEHKDFIGNGAADDFPTYKAYCGMVNGLEIAIREIDDMIRNNDIEDFGETSIQ